MWRSSTSSSNTPELVRFVEECLVFGLLLLLAHAVVYAVRGSQDVPREVALLRKAVALGNTDVLFVGDSSLFMGASEEADVRTIPAMLQEQLPGMKIVEISSAAGQMELYEMYGAYLAEHPGTVETIIVPLNLRMLAPQLEVLSYRYFDQERLFFENDAWWLKILYRPLSVFKTFDFRSARPDEFAEAPVLDGQSDLGELGEFNPAVSVPVSPEQRARIVTFSYMYELAEDSLVVRRLETLLGHLNAAGVQSVFYVVPIDVEACSDDLGPRFSQQIDSNVQLLADTVLSRGGVFLNLVDTVQSEHFAWDHYPNEHLDATGRAQVARELAQALAATEADIR